MRTIASLVMVSLLCAFFPVPGAFADTIEQECRDALGVGSFTGRNSTLIYKLNRCVNNKRKDAAIDVRRMQVEERQELRFENARRRANRMLEEQNTEASRDLIQQTQARERFTRGFAKKGRFNLFRKQRTIERNQIRAGEWGAAMPKELPSAKDAALEKARQACDGLLSRMKASCVRSELLKSRPTRQTGR